MLVARWRRVVVAGDILGRKEIRVQAVGKLSRYGSVKNNIYICVHK
jgi:hypothetical protein